MRIYLYANLNVHNVIANAGPKYICSSTSLLLRGRMDKLIRCNAVSTGTC